MANNLDLQIRIRANADGTSSVISSTTREINNMSESTRSSNAEMTTLTRTSGVLGGAMSVLGGAIGAIGIASLAKDIFAVNREFQTLRSSLQTVTGSAENAQKAFAGIQSFASQTPYTVNQITESFIKLKALGLDPSAKALTSYGNTASSMGKSLNQMIEAVADATTGEFERLKEFGIKSKQQGDEVTFTFRGISTTVNKSADEITGYLQNIGNTDFAGAMSLQMTTISGSLSNLSDAWSQFADRLIITQAEIGIASFINDFADVLKNLDKVFIASMSTADKFRVTIVTAFSSIVLQVEFAFKGMVNSAMSVLSDFVGGIADGLNFVGIDSLSSSFDSFSQSIKPSVNSSKQLNEALIALNSSADAEKAAIDDLAVSYFVFLDAQEKQKLSYLDAAENKNAQAEQDKLNAEIALQSAEELKQSFDKELEKLITKNITLAAGERALFTYQLAQKGFTTEQKKTALAIYDANKAMEKQKKAALNSEKTQKASNKLIADGLNNIDRYLKDASASSQDIFSGPADSINNMANGINAMSKALNVNSGYVEENKKAWDELNKSTSGTDEERAQKTKEFAARDNALAKKSIDIKLQGFNTVGSAFVGMFDDMAAAAEQGSKKQEALQKTAMGITMVMATINGVAAVIAAFKDGGFPMAIAVGAAVAAQLATIGVQMAAIGGGSSAPELQKTQGRGTVLGDPSAVSESFSNSLGHLEDSTDFSLVQSSKMLVFLQNIDNNTKALAIGINRSDQYQGFSANPTVGLGKNLTGGILKMSNAITGFNDILGSIPIFGGAMKGFAEALFGYKEKVRDTGVSFNTDQTLGQARQNGLDSNYYARVDTYQKIFGFKTNSETLNLEQAIDGEIATWFSGIVNNSTDAVLSGLEILAGDGYAALQDKILNSTLNLEKISLKGLDTAGIEEALAGVFSASADKLVADNFPALNSFQQVGEGMFETLVRVSHGVEQAQVSLSQFGFKAIDFTEIINKQGDTGGQVAKQTILLNESFDNINDVMKNVSGSTEDVIGVYKDLVKTQKLLISSGFGDNVDLVSASNAAGGIGNFQSALESYRENFMTDSQRLNADLNDMADQFKILGVVFPENIADYTKAVTASGFDIKAATQEFMKGIASPEDLGLTLQLSDAANQLYSDWGKLNRVLTENTTVLQQTYDRLNQSDLEKSLRGIAESFTESILSIRDAGGSTEQMLQALNLGLLTGADAIQKAKKSIDDLYKGIYKNIADQKTSLSDAITKLVDPDALFQIQADRYTALLENGSYEEQMQAARSLQDLIIGQYQEQGDTITSMVDSVKQIGTYLDSLNLNDTLSVLTPAQMLGEAQGQFQKQLILAQSGNADAMSTITDFADTYLNKARSFYASSDTYTGIFDSVTKALGDINAPDAKDYAKVTSESTREAVTWLESISASLDTIKNDQTLKQQNELSTGLSQAQGIRSEFIGGIASGTNTSSAAIEGLLTNGINKSLANKKISDQVIAEYAKSHTFKETYDASIANGISSIQLANATGWDRKNIVDWAKQNGLEGFSDGGINSQPAIFGDAAAPLQDGRIIPVTLSGGDNNALIEEIRALKQEVSELRKEQADQTNALIESNYDANEQAAEKVSSVQEDVNWTNTQVAEIA